MRSTKGTWLLVALAVIADVAGIASLLGLSSGDERLLVGGATVVTLLTVAAVALIFRQRKQIRSAAAPIARVPHLSQAVSSLDFSGAHEIYCLGSGTETYYGLLEPRFRDGTIPRGASVRVGFRTGSGTGRTAKLAEYSKKWIDLAERHNLRIQFYAIDDFDHALRGVLIDDRAAALGFYFRENGRTIGGDSDVLLVDATSEVGRFLITAFRRVFDCRGPRETMQQVS